MEEIALVFAYAFAVGLVSSFVQFWTQMKDSNNNGVQDWDDFDILKFGQTGIVSGIAAGYLAVTGVILDPVWLAIVGASVEKIIGVVTKAITGGSSIKKIVGLSK